MDSHSPADTPSFTVEPGFSAWLELAERNQGARASWTFEVCGTPALTFASAARSQFLNGASMWTQSAGIQARQPRGGDTPLVVTGHQPEFYHPGVWIKDFLVQKASERFGFDAVDIVVDSDTADAVAANVPCREPAVARCAPMLVSKPEGSCFALEPAPTRQQVDEFCDQLRSAARSLDVPRLAENVEAFCNLMRDDSYQPGSIADFMTVARRRHEGDKHDYLELPVTSVARMPAFSAFVLDIACDAHRFAEAYNEALGDFRVAHAVRSAAQPFPSLRRSGEDVELPFWHLSDLGRRPVWVRRSGDQTVLTADEEVLAEIDNISPDVLASLSGDRHVLAPKALALTLFLRMFCCDLFVHGTGGGRYDQVADGVCTRYYGVEPPAFAVATMTAVLDLGVPFVDENEVGALQKRINRLTHNPDAYLLGDESSDIALDENLQALIAEKKSLVEGIALPDADKKTMGIRIKQINSQLADAVAPMRSKLESEMAETRTKAHDSRIARDRTYSYFLWTSDEMSTLVDRFIDEKR